MQRFKQGVRALFAFTTSVDFELAERYLSPQQMTLFRQMAKPEQLHSLNVLRDVLAQATTTPHDLAVAALLHDVGKSRYHLAVWQKTLSVLISKLLPPLDNRLSIEATLTFWRAPFIVRRHHPQWGGDLLSAYAPDCVIWLVSHHADSADDWQHHAYYDLLVRLQIADDAN